MGKIQGRFALAFICSLFVALCVVVAGASIAIGDPDEASTAASETATSTASEESEQANEDADKGEASDTESVESEQAVGEDNDNDNDNDKEATSNTDKETTPARANAPRRAPSSPSSRTRLGNVNVRFTVYPNTSEGGSLSGNNLSITPGTNGKVSVTLGLDLSTSGSEPAKPGELELLIPRSIFQVRDFSKVKVDIPYSANGLGDWKYSYIKEDGTSCSANDPSCKYIKLVNNISIQPAHTQSMSIAYSVDYASDIIDGSNVDFEPIVTLTKDDGGETKTGTKLNIKVDTAAKIANAAKSTYNSYVTDQWLNVWGSKPSWLEGHESEYFFLMWEISAYATSDATQPYTLTYSEPNPVPDGGIICGYMDWYDNNSGSGKRDDQENKAALLSNPPVKEVATPSKFNNDWFSGVLVAYKKPATTPKEYNNTFTAKLTPKDGKDPATTKEDSGKFTYKDIALNTPTGEMYYLEKLKGWIGNDALYRRLHGGIDRLQAGVPIDDIAYSISGYAYQYTKNQNNPDELKSWGAEYTSELVDDMFFLNVNANCRLGNGDMEITRINPRWEAYEYHSNMASGGYEEVEVDYTVAGDSGSVHAAAWAKDYPELIAYGKSDSGSWQKIATFAINTKGYPEVKEIHLDGASYFNESNHLGGIKISKGTGITQIKYSITANEGKSTEDNQGVIRVRFERRISPGGAFKSYDATSKSELYLTLYASDKVKAEIEKVIADNVVSDLAVDNNKDGDGGEGDGEAPIAKLHNIDHIAVYTGVNSEQTRNADLKGAFLTGPETDPNFAGVLNSHDQALYGNGKYMWHKKAQIELAKYKYDSTINKTSEYENDPANSRVIIHYTSEAKEAAITHDTDLPQELIDYGIIRIQQAGTFYDLLPMGMTVNPESIKAEACAADAKVEVEYEMIRNYKDSGRTLLIIKTATDAPNWKSSGSWNDGITWNADNRGQGSVLYHIESGFTVHYDGYYDWESLEDYGNKVTNYIGFESENDEIKHGVDDDASKWPYTDFSSVEEYFTDLDETEPKLDEDGNPIERRNFLYANSSTTLTVVTQARYGLTKKITGPTVSTWTDGRVGDGEDMQVGVPTGGQYQYRLRYASEPSTTVKNMVLFDALEAYEYIRDKATVDDSGNPTGEPKSDPIDIDRPDSGYEVVTWQGTFESIDVSKIESMGAKASLYYTTKDREQLQVDDQSDGSDTLSDRTDPAGSTLAECWEGPFTAAELNALDETTKATITGLAIDMRKKKNGTGDFELDSGKSVAAIVTMRAPDDPAFVRDLLQKAQDQYDAASDTDKNITNDKPYTYNAINMNAQVKETGAGSYSNAHLITYEYTRAYLYTPHGNLSIQKQVTGLTEEEAADYSFTVRPQVTLPDNDNTVAPFSGKYNRIDTHTGYYYTDDTAKAPYTDDEGVYHAEGLVMVNMSDSSFGPYYVTWDVTGGNDGTGAWVPCDAYGSIYGTQIAADEEAYTFVTGDGQETFTIQGNQRIVLLDCEADLNWTVEELEESAVGFRTSNTVNGTDSANNFTTNPFVIGDKNTARIIYTNMATAELVIAKMVDVGDEDKVFDFTVKITDRNGDEYVSWEGNPTKFEYVGEADEDVAVPASGKLQSGDTIHLMHGQRIRIFIPAGSLYEVKEVVPSNYEDPAIEQTYNKLVVEGEGEETTTSFETTTSASDGTGRIENRGDNVTETFTNTHKPDEKPKKSVTGNDVEGASGDEADVTNEDQTQVVLGKYENPFTYTVTQEIPIETKKVVLTDALEDVLEFVSSADKVEVQDGDGNVLESNDDISVDVTISGKTLTITIEFVEPYLKDAEGTMIGAKNNLEELLKERVTYSFDARVSDGADLAPYSVTGESVISNTAQVQFNNRPAVDSNSVTVTPPGPDEKIEKDVMDQEHYNLATPQEVYQYHIDAVVPVDATHVVVTDTLEPVLEFASAADQVGVTYKGKPVKGAVAAINTGTRTLTVTLGEYQDTDENGTPITANAAIEQRTRTITITFSARIIKGANLEPYATTGSVLVSNTAAYEINNDSNRKHETKPVTVTPPEDEPGINKRVNRVEHKDLASAKEVFKYTLNMYVPASADTFVVTDTLESVLEFVSNENNIKLTTDDGSVIKGAKVKIANNKLTVNFGASVVKGSEGSSGLRTKWVTVAFDARIKDGADLSRYANSKVPNKASYVINNDRNSSYDSNTVTVRPPNNDEGDGSSKKGKGTGRGFPRTGDFLTILPFILAALGAVAVVLFAREMRWRKRWRARKH